MRPKSYKEVECDECQGSGKCFFCGGSGSGANKKQCSGCQPPGTGKCSKCSGTGKMFETRAH